MAAARRRVGRNGIPGCTLRAYPGYRLFPADKLVRTPDLENRCGSKLQLAIGAEPVGDRQVELPPTRTMRRLTLR